MVDIGATLPILKLGMSIMIANPKISVVMPAYNAEIYLRDAVSSILNQTFRDFEFIIVNDGSSDATASILQEFERLDSRVKVVHQDNQGMISALNCGCRLARGQYIARMDADDFSLPRRFERQLEHIQRHPQIGILGTWISNVDGTGSVSGTWRAPTNPKLAKWTNFFGVCVSHSSVLMQRKILERLDFYRPEAVHGEDVDLWLRACSITEFGNVPEILNMYRVWNGSTHQMGMQIRRNTHVQLLASHIGYFLKIQPPIEAVAGLRKTRVGPAHDSLREILLTASLIEKLYQRFVNGLALPERQEVSWDAATKVASLGLQAWRFDRAKSISLLMRALKLDCRLLSPRAIAQGWRRKIQLNAQRAA